MDKYFMGIDCGTGSVRVAIFDTSGHNLAYSVAEYGTTYPKNGWAEQDDEEWFGALKTAIPECITKAGVNAEDIAAICCDATTNTLVYLDAQGKSVRKPILWMDVRATEEANFIDEIRSEYEATRFYKPAFRADTMIPKNMWVKKNEPANWEKTEIMFEFLDWINWQLTDKFTLSKSIAAFRWNYDDKNGGHPTALYDACGIGDVMDKIPSEVLAVGDIVGNVSSRAAQEFGLSTNTVVVEGSADCNACMFGVGGVTPGGMTLIGGTSSCLLGLSTTDFHVNGVNGTYPNCMSEGTSLLEGGQTASGAILTWFRNNLIPASWIEEATAKNMNIYDYITSQAQKIKIGADGIIMMDYFQGNRAPYADSLARGMFWGLSIGTTPAHLARAVFEGVAYGANHCILSMKDAGYDVSEIFACGGIATSPFWLQMHADVIGVPIHTTVESQSAGCLGDAIIASVGVGVFGNFQEAADAMVRRDKTYTPDAKAHEEYKFYMDRYIETWPAMRDIVHKTVKHSQ